MLRLELGQSMGTAWAQHRESMGQVWWREEHGQSLGRARAKHGDGQSTNCRTWSMGRAWACANQTKGHCRRQLRNAVQQINNGYSTPVEYVLHSRTILYCTTKYCKNKHYCLLYSTIPGTVLYIVQYNTVLYSYCIYYIIFVLLGCEVSRRRTVP